MKKIIINLYFLFMLLPLVAEAQDNFGMKTISEVKSTPVENQYRTSTCWSFSTLSFYESEMLRKGKKAVDLSEMFVVWHTYFDKAVRYARMHGKINFGAGGAIHDVTNVIRDYGIVPESVYSGLLHKQNNHVHAELDAALKAYMDAIIKNPQKTLTESWKVGVKGILNAYLGEIPEKFEYKGNQYTPKSFAEKVVGINTKDYVYFSSFTHHPFYQQFIIEVPDNWGWGTAYNVPLDEMNEIMINAIKEGYSMAWASDVSEDYFSTVSQVPEKDISDFSRAERSLYLSKPVKQKEITQEMRQKAFDNYETTDDHGMHIIGLSKDKEGNKYFYIKNSWGTQMGEAGYFYFSIPYVKYKTLSFIVHKDAVPKNIRKKCGF